MAKGNSRHFEIKHTKKGMKNLVRKIVWMQAYGASSGIQKNEGRRFVDNGSGIKLAKLASILEEFASWIQPKTVILTNYKGEKRAIVAGTRLSRPARPFIKLNKIPEIWNRIRIFYRNLVSAHFKSTSKNYKMGARNIMIKLGEEAKREQKSVIDSKISAENNVKYTEWQKGFNHPLFNSGRLRDAIRNKLIPAFKGKAQRDEHNLKYLTQIDELIKKINGR